MHRRLLLGVGMGALGLLAGCGSDEGSSAERSATAVEDDAWFSVRPVSEVGEAPCGDEAVPSADASRCYGLGEELVGSNDVISAEAAGQRECPGGEADCAIEAAAPAASWSVGFTISDEALRRFNDAATRCYERSPTCPSGEIAIVVDGAVVSAPVIQVPTFESGSFSVGGDLSEAEARELASRLD